MVLVRQWCSGRQTHFVTQVRNDMRSCMINNARIIAYEPLYELGIRMIGETK